MLPGAESVDTAFMDGLITDDERHVLRQSIRSRKNEISWRKLAERFAR